MPPDRFWRLFFADLRKFIDPSIDHQYTKQQLPWRRFRYAEILLNYAEACIALGEKTEARQYINQIRNIQQKWFEAG